MFPKRKKCRLFIYNTFWWIGVTIMQIAVKSFRLILARFQMNNLLDFSKLFFPLSIFFMSFHMSNPNDVCVSEFFINISDCTHDSPHLRNLLESSYKVCYSFQNNVLWFLFSFFGLFRKYLKTVKWFHTSHHL